MGGPMGVPESVGDRWDRRQRRDGFKCGNWAFIIFLVFILILWGWGTWW
jgi:hypothetical protein